MQWAIDKLDRNGDGHVSRQEFVQVMLSNDAVAGIVGLSQASGDRLNDFFSQIDENDDAHLSAVELQRHLASVYRSSSERQ